MWPGCQASRLSEHSKSHSCCIWFDFPADTECSWMASQHPFFPCCISGSGTEQQRQTSSVWISSQEGQLPAPPPPAPGRFHLLSESCHSRTTTRVPGASTLCHPVLQAAFSFTLPTGTDLYVPDLAPQKVPPLCWALCPLLVTDQLCGGERGPF